MSSTTMSQNQEIIEAKLCAYIDGELDLEGRSEIERHLEANPQHRRLLESLKATKDLVRWLPRDPAPPEVSETLNGQLERSVLLDYDGDSLRPSILPRVLAAAAIVALTAGLGAAVYFALPKSQKPATPYAFRSNEPSTLTPAVPGPEVAQTESEKTPETLLGKPEAKFENLAEGQARSAQVEELTRPDRSRELDALVTEVSQNRAALFAAAHNSNAVATPIANNAMVMLVRSDVPQRTEKQLVSFMDSQKIRWKQAPVQAEAGQQGIAGQSWYDVTRQQALGTDVTRTLNQATTQPARDEPQNQSNVAGVYVARMSLQQAAELNTTISSDGAQAVALQSPAGAMAGNLAPLQQAQAPTTAPSTQPAAAPQSPLAGGLAALEPAPSQPSPPAAIAPPATQPADRTRRQAERGTPLQDASAAPTTKPTTEPAATAAVPTTEPSDTALDVVILVQPNTVTSSAAAPTTQPASQAATPPATQPAQ